eukprot:scaffold30005_cov66-Phaeocystis_antarctica.AAC.3
MTSGDASHPAAAISGSCACECSKRRAACENCGSAVSGRAAATFAGNDSISTAFRSRRVHPKFGFGEIRSHAISSTYKTQ